MNKRLKGPAYLEGWTIGEQLSASFKQWSAQLKSPSGQTQFYLQYYGELHEEYNNLIVNTTMAPLLLVARAVASTEKVVLFDGCQHGYNALFCEAFTEKQKRDRRLASIYRNQKGEEVFEVFLTAYYTIDYEEELREEVEEEGKIELIDGSKLDWEQVKRNGYDALQIWAKNQQGTVLEVLSQELA